MGEDSGLVSAGPTVVEFITEWIDLNVRSHPFPEDVSGAIQALAQQCLNAATVAGFSADDIERETGCKAIDLIAATFLTRWNPTSGHGGSA
jgi:hypothetical protein